MTEWQFNDCWSLNCHSSDQEKVSWMTQWQFRDKQTLPKIWGIVIRWQTVAELPLGHSNSNSNANGVRGILNSHSVASDRPCTTYNPYMTASFVCYARANNVKSTSDLWNVKKSEQQQPMLMCHELCMNESACHLLHSETKSSSNIIMQIICKMNALCMMQI